MIARSAFQICFGSRSSNASVNFLTNACESKFWKSEIFALGELVYNFRAGTRAHFHSLVHSNNGTT